MSLLDSIHEVYRLLFNNGLGREVLGAGIYIKPTLHGGLKMQVYWSLDGYRNWPAFTPAEREEAHKGLRLAQKVLEDNGYKVTPVEQTGEYNFAGLTHLLIPVEQE